jgi:hypothetical protein
MGPAGFALVLAFAAGFLAAGLGTAVPAGAAAAGAGWACAHADVTKHDRTNATAKDRIMEAREMGG